MRINKDYILTLGIAFVFLASGVRAFVNPDDTRELLQSSFISHPLLAVLPSLVSIIGLHDLIIGILVAIRFMPKYIVSWIVIWMGIVIVICLSTFSITNSLDALEHSIIFTTALFLTIAAWSRPAPQRFSNKTLIEQLPPNVPTAPPPLP